MLISLFLTKNLIPLAAIFAFTLVFILILMRPRRFYFVRHGETILNAEHIRQGEEGSLSENGRHQAEKVGKYLKRFHVKQIISSTYPRARETAAIISVQLSVPITYSAILVERRNPSEIIGRSRDDRSVALIVDKIDLAYHEDEYRFSDEENFIDLKRRARRCLNFLTRRMARETVVITHHVFLKMLVAYLLYHKRLHAADFAKLSFFNTSDNASITVCEFHPWKLFSSTRGWEIISYNEQP